LVILASDADLITGVITVYSSDNRRFYNKQQIFMFSGVGSCDLQNFKETFLRLYSTQSVFNLHKATHLSINASKKTSTQQRPSGNLETLQKHFFVQLSFRLKAGSLYRKKNSFHHRTFALSKRLRKV
jgi:hypothetical protein